MRTDQPGDDLRPSAANPIPECGSGPRVGTCDAIAWQLTDGCWGWNGVGETRLRRCAFELLGQQGAAVVRRVELAREPGRLAG